MIIYFDSSALVKMFVEEEGSPAIKKFASDALPKENVIFATSAVTKAEVMAGLAAMRRGRYLTQRRFQKAVMDFRERWKVFHIPEVTVFLIDRSGEIGLNHKIKGCDAFQLASALGVEVDLFVSTDKDLNAAASQNGLDVWNPMSETIPVITTNNDGQSIPDHR
jgi:predicted nucleic acid-binding protein